MCSILHMLARLVHCHRHNKQRMLFSNYYGLLLAIVKMRRKHSVSTRIEVECIHLLCMITVDVFENESRQKEAITSVGICRNITSPNIKNKAMTPITLIDAALCAISKKGASVCMILDCLCMFRQCTQVPVLRQTIGLEGITIIVRIMLSPRSKPSATSAIVCVNDDITRLGMIFLEGMSQERIFALHPDLQKAVGVSTTKTLFDNTQHCCTRDSARESIQNNMQDNEIQD